MMNAIVNIIISDRAIYFTATKAVTYSSFGLT